MVSHEDAIKQGLDEQYSPMFEFDLLGFCGGWVLGRSMLFPPPHRPASPSGTDRDSS
jgi:hypothetical protein